MPLGKDGRMHKWQDTRIRLQTQYVCTMIKFNNESKRQGNV